MSLCFYNGTHFKDGPDTVPTERRITASVLVLSAISSILCFVTVSSVLLSKKTRKKGFNLYLIFLLVPDINYNVWQVVLRATTLKSGVMYMKGRCIGSNMFGISYVTINLWMNVLIAREVYIMLQRSKQTQRFTPTSPKLVFRQVAVVYTIGFLSSLAGTFNLNPVFDVRLNPKNCSPRFYGTQGFIIGYMLFGILYCIPSVYIIYITFTVYRKKLLPPAGKCRFLAVYFLRITIFVFAATMTVFFIILFDVVNIYLFLNALQGIIVSLMSTQKGDIRKAIRETYCRCCPRPK